MPYFFRLSDGRLLFFWNNTSPLPTRDISEYPEANAGERSGKWELAFTNRDALHAAISEDDGQTWIGFREIILNPARNDADFREHVNDPAEEHDTVRDVLQLCRIRDERLVSDRQGVVWNFPAGLTGRLEVECRIDGEGFQLALCDHWINPCDETVAEKAALTIPVTAETIGGFRKWTTLTLVWDWKDGKALLVCGGLSRTFELRTGGLSPFGPSYLHLQTLARETDSKGAYFRAFRKTARR